MAILKYDSKEAVPEDLREFAKEDGDQFVVNVGPKATIKEFRDNNQKLQNEKDAALEKLKALEKVVGDDPDGFKEKIAELEATAQKVADGKLKGSDEIEKEIERRIAAVKEAKDAKIAEKEAELAELRGTVEKQSTTIYETELAEYIRSEAVKEDIGVDMAALPYIISDAKREFEKDENGNFVRKVDGKVQLGEDGYTPQTGNEWLKSRKETSPFFFKQSSGGGASGDGDGKFGGFSQQEFMKLSPAEKLAIANTPSS